MSRTLDAPTPTNISTKSEPDIVKNGTPASPAIARASKVLPVPGGPTSSAPVGIMPPSRENFSGSFRKSTISSSSSLASSMPATSANVMRPCLSVRSRAFDLPKPIAPPRPPPCIRLIRYSHTPRRMMNGRIGARKDINPLGSCGFASIKTSFASNVSVTSTSRGRMTTNCRPLPARAMIFSPSRTTLSISPASTCSMNFERATVGVLEMRPPPVNTLNSTITNTNNAPHRSKFLMPFPNEFPPDQVNAVDGRTAKDVENSKLSFTIDNCKAAEFKPAQNLGRRHHGRRPSETAIRWAFRQTARTATLHQPGVQGMR